MFADLHLHSTYSDGTDTPLELCQLAKEHDIKVISIADHDTVGGYKELFEAQMLRDIKVIPGIEISMLSNHKMLHILGYYIDIYNKKLEHFIEVISADKTETTRLNFEKARKDNVFSYEWERVLELNTSQPRIGGSCVVKAMSIDGYEVPGMGLRDMYHQCFWYENNDYIWNATYNGYDAINMIKSIGGIPVIAHPKSINDDDIVLNLIQHGTEGLEVFHPMHSNEDSSKYLQMAIDKRLYISGGSDWHGKNSYKGSVFAMTGLTHENYELLKL